MLDFLREQWTMLEKRFEIVDFFENRRTNGVKVYHLIDLVECSDSSPPDRQ